MTKQFALVTDEENTLVGIVLEGKEYATRQKEVPAEAEGILFIDRLLGQQQDNIEDSI